MFYHITFHFNSLHLKTFIVISSHRSCLLQLAISLCSQC